MIGKRSLRAGIALLLLAQGLAGCGGSGSPAAPEPSPVAQPPVTQPPDTQPPMIPTLAVFTDPASGFSTLDVRDVDDQIVHFDTAGHIIWTADGTRFPEFLAQGNLIAYHHRGEYFWQVRFGTKHGERRAYLTDTDDRLRGATPTVLDLSLDERGGLVIAATSVPVPST